MFLLGLEGGGPAAREVLVHVHGRLRLAVDRALADRRRPLTAHLGPAERAAPLPARRLGNRVQLRRWLIPWAQTSTCGPSLVEALVEGAVKVCATHVVDCRTGRAARRQCPSEHAAVLRAPVLQQQPLLRVLVGPRSVQYGFAALERGLKGDREACFISGFEKLLAVPACISVS